MGKFNGIEAMCYSRNVEIGGLIIFQPATLIMNIVALCMTSVMVYHVKTKYTAVGRKEIAMFLQLYLVTVFLEMLLLSNIIPTASILYPYFTAAHLGLITATCWCLLLNGFIGFQFIEDGTKISLWIMRISSFIVFLLVWIISILTFLNISPFSTATASMIWTIYYILNGIMIFTYTVSQIILVVYTLEDRWPLGDIAFGVLFFVSGLVTMYVFSVTICEEVKHYLDGMFFGTMFNLLSVMMIYKYWDSITKEDLEFSIDAKQRTWELETLLVNEKEK
ncbi:hypothetical protein RO3G_01299 [Rhizopus delemar RA 99-880]|uniref:Chitin synthase export chaperone n=1 Tax=Rhizopus delemar (strain RA 99-880 / ATCC MYA-4621 / FGSC 9543 / NRRL 43880) TaxID=246409 RepID=I1BK65_RHIO9|nr:hypothetical protein RO3G_01299 [Rhizopus delemar RA 99-880]|eukprot:EIE76595.1 hypothetical protein RO3G_01299 [Rhizopus delemar RA 99-880]